MSSPPLAVIVMAAGLGTRMRSAVPKHLHTLLGRRLVDWVVEAARPLLPQPLVVVASPQTKAALADTDGLVVAVQERPLGTGDAARAAQPALSDFPGDILVLPGDTPLLTPELLDGLLSEHGPGPTSPSSPSSRRTPEPTGASSGTRMAPSLPSSRQQTPPPGSSLFGR